MCRSTKPLVTTSPAQSTTVAPVAAPSTAGDIAVVARIDFETGGGTWEVTDGTDVLGCDGGSFTEDGFAAGIERTLSCEDGERAGTIVVRFSPEPVEPDSDDFASDWTVHAATGDFVGLRLHGHAVDKVLILHLTRHFRDNRMGVRIPVRRI